jgi:hypothetical protein
MGVMQVQCGSNLRASSTLPTGTISSSAPLPALPNGHMSLLITLLNHPSKCCSVL